MIERLAVAAATIAVYDGFRALTHHDETVAAVLLTLGAAAVSQLPVDLAARWVLRLRPTFSARTRLAWLAIASSGMLMAIGYRGVDGRGPGRHLGAVAVLHAVARGVVRVRTARLRDARRTARRSRRSRWRPSSAASFRPVTRSASPRCRSRWPARSACRPRDTTDLEMAALLHHLGQVTIDEPEDPSRPTPPSEVAAVTSTMLREIKPLAGAGDIVAGDAAEPRRRRARCRCCASPATTTT